MYRDDAPLIETISALGCENNRLRKELDEAKASQARYRSEAERLNDALWMALWEKAGKPDGVYEYFFPKYEHDGKWYPVRMPFGVLRSECLGTSLRAGKDGRDQ